MFRIANIIRKPTIRTTYRPRYLTQTPSRPFSSSKFRPRPYIRFESSPKSPLDFKRWDSQIKMGAVIVVFGSIYYVSHLEQVAETGRWRFMNTGPQFEEKISKLARQQSEEEYRDHILPSNHPISKHVRRVVSRILAANNMGSLRGIVSPTPVANYGEDSWNPDGEHAASSNREWDIMVVNDPKTVNAQVVPGLIIVYTGILPVCQDEQGLAAVLSHEIGHVVARHAAERMSSQTIMIALLVLLQTLGFDAGISGFLQRYLFELPNSRTQELEADLIGLTLMSRACFDPKAAPEMFRRMGQIEAQIASKYDLEFFRTHPSSVTRVEHLEKALPEGYAVLAANPECAPIQDSIRGFRELALGGGGEGFFS